MSKLEEAFCYKCEICELEKHGEWVERRPKGWVTTGNPYGGPPYHQYCSESCVQKSEKRLKEKHRLSENRKYLKDLC